MLSALASGEGISLALESSINATQFAVESLVALDIASALQNVATLQQPLSDFVSATLALYNGDEMTALVSACGVVSAARCTGAVVRLRHDTTTLVVRVNGYVPLFFGAICRFP